MITDTSIPSRKPYAWERKTQIQCLTPHQAKPVLIPLSNTAQPTILIAHTAWRDMNYIIQAAGDKEIGWLGSVKALVGGRYRIERVFLFDQEVSDSHCQFDERSIEKFYREKLNEDSANQALLSSIRFWGHLHPGTLTDPSHQDEEQMRLFKENPYFIRAICTRAGQCVFTFFDFIHKFKIVDCPWHIDLDEDEQRKNDVKAEVRRCVKSAVFPLLSSGSSSLGLGRIFGNDSE